jgi:hypothetical protein
LVVSIIGDALKDEAVPVGVVTGIESERKRGHQPLFAGSGGRLLFLSLHGPRGHDAVLPHVGDELAQVFVRVGNEIIEGIGSHLQQTIGEKFPS